MIANGREYHAFLKDQGFGYTLIERADKSSEYLDEFSKLDGFEQITMIVRARQFTLKSSTASFCL